MTDPVKPVRRDGWTAARRAGFIDALAKTGNVRAAAAAVGMSHVSAYKLRNRSGEERFRTAWDIATGARIERFTDLAMERISEGTARPLVHNGRIIGYRVDHDDKLLMSMLRRPARANRARLADEFGRALEKLTART